MLIVVLIPVVAQIVARDRRSGCSIALDRQVVPVPGRSGSSSARSPASASPRLALMITAGETADVGAGVPLRPLGRVDRVLGRVRPHRGHRARAVRHPRACCSSRTSGSRRTTSSIGAWASATRCSASRRRGAEQGPRVPRALRRSSSASLGFVVFVVGVFVTAGDRRARGRVPLPLRHRASPSRPSA